MMFDQMKEMRAAAEQTAGRLEETEGLWRYLVLGMLAALISVSWNQFWWGVIALKMLFA